MPVADSPDFQLTVSLTAVPGKDAPDWQKTAVGPGGVPISAGCEITDGLPVPTVVSVCSGSVVLGGVAAGNSQWTQQTGIWSFSVPGIASTIEAELAGPCAVNDILTIVSVSAGVYQAQWKAPSSSSAYASLTGAGQTATPGDLTQAGGLTVNESGATGINLNDSGSGGINAIESGTAPIILEVSNPANSAGMYLADLGTGGVNIQANGGGLLGFFGVGAVAQPAAPVTLADVIAVLHDFGLTA